LSKRVKAKEREARALMRLVKPMTIAPSFCVSGTITKSCHRPLCPAGMSAISSVFEVHQHEIGAQQLQKDRSQKLGRGPLLLGLSWDIRHVPSKCQSDFTSPEQMKSVLKYALADTAVHIH
jgi:hypothetical protein